MYPSVFPMDTSYIPTINYQNREAGSGTIYVYSSVISSPVETTITTKIFCIVASPSLCYP